MEFKGTKGEWRCVHGKGAFEIIIQGIRPIVIPGYGLEEAQANAKLIAAAPDLLEALQELLNTCPCDPDITSEFWQANQKAKQAIEKALK